MGRKGLQLLWCVESLWAPYGLTNHKALIYLVAQKFESVTNICPALLSLQYFSHSFTELRKTVEKREVS